MSEPEGARREAARGGAPPEKDPRVYLAGERTMLAWVRTGLAMMAFGFVVARFALFLREVAATRGAPTPRTGASLWLGTGIVLLGVAVNILGAVRHARFSRKFHRGETELTPPGLAETVVPTVLAVIGFGMAIYLATLSVD
jgi:putative membrane protein